MELKEAAVAEICVKTEIELFSRSRSRRRVSLALLRPGSVRRVK